MVRSKEGIKAAQRRRVGNTGVVCIKGDEIGDSHVLELADHDGTVEGLSPAALMLSALIHERHDDVNTLGNAGDGADHPLHVLVVVIGRLIIGKTVHLIGNAVVHDIGNQINILSSGRFEKRRLGFSRIKTVCRKL